MQIDVIGYVNILIGITDILLGIFVWQGNKKRDINISYALCTLTMGLWSFSLYFYNNPLFFDSVIWLKIVYVLAYLMTITQIDFAIKFNKISGRTLNKIFIPIILVFLGLGLYLLLVRNSVIIDVKNEGSLAIATMGPGYIPYFIPIIASLFFLFGSYISTSKKLSGILKRQTELYWVGGFLMIAPLFVMDFVLPIFFKNTEFYRFSTLGNILWSVMIGYSIINTRFLDVRVVLGNFLRVFIKSIFLFTLTFFVIYFSCKGLFFRLDLKGILLLIPFSLLVGLLFNWVIKLAENFIEKKLVYSIYNPIEELQKYSSLNANTLAIEDIIDNTITSLNLTLKPKSIFISVIDKATNLEIKSKGKNFEAIGKDSYELFLKSWQGLNSNRILVYSEIKNAPSSGKKIIDDRKKYIVDFMERYKVDIVMPVQEGNLVAGLIMLSEKADNSIYTLGDIRFLESISQNMSLRIGQAALYEKIKTLNESLKQKVSEQTSELQKQVKELELARQKETDMIDIMGHELRTPMSVVRVNTELLEKFVVQNITVKNSFDKYLTRIKESVETGIKLINTLLTSAKLEGEKIELNLEKVDINNEVNMLFHAHELDAREKGLFLDSDLDNRHPFVYADHARVVEILNNLISNAIKYTMKGSVTVKTSVENNFVKISVIDTGQGIAKNDLDMLGTKFYRAGNYIRGNGNNDNEVEIVRPGGTGLGLYVSFNLVKKMGGKVSVESELGKGSSFIFTLPLYAGQINDKPGNENSNDMFVKLGLKN